MPAPRLPSYLGMFTLTQLAGNPYVPDATTFAAPDALSVTVTYASFPEPGQTSPLMVSTYCSLS